MSQSLTAKAQKQKRETIQFANKISDFPIMNGLYEIKSESVSYDKPYGRIVSLTLGTEGIELKEQDIRAYYSATLPQLGWAPVTKQSKKPDIYLRGAEHLILNFEKMKQKKTPESLILTIQIIPVNKQTPLIH